VPEMRRAPYAQRSLSIAAPLCTRAHRKGQLRQWRARTPRTCRAARHTVGAARDSPSLALPSSSYCRVQVTDPDREPMLGALERAMRDRDPNESPETDSYSAKTAKPVVPAEIPREAAAYLRLAAGRRRRRPRPRDPRIRDRGRHGQGSTGLLRRRRDIVWQTTD